MGEEEPVNEVFMVGSDGKSVPEKTLDEVTEKTDLSSVGGKVLENNGLKELEEHDVKEIGEDKKADVVEEDKKVGIVEEVKEDKKDNHVDELKEGERKDGAEELNEDKKDDGVEEEIKEDKEIEGVKGVKEDKEIDGVNEEVEDKIDDSAIETEEDKKDDNGCENEKMDKDTTVKETAETKEETDKGEAEKLEVDAMEVESSSIDKEESSEKEKMEEEMEEEDNIDKPKEEKVYHSKVEKGLQKPGSKRINREKGKEKTKELKKTEPRTPTIDRPVRERKSVERLVTSIEKDANKEFQIKKGRGTPLKDIPNVAFKLSRKKTDDTFKLLHTILFGRRGKAVEVKSNISRFSGFVWHDDEEKQMIKVKEKFDKCKKEKLQEFCDVLDITFTKTTRKEDIIVKLVDFLIAPHATTTVLLAEKEKSSKGTKRKRSVKSRSGTMTSKRSAKSRKKNSDSLAVERRITTDTEDESKEEKGGESEEENENGVPEKLEDEKIEKSESEDKSDAESESKDVKKSKKTCKIALTKKESAAKSKIEKISVTKKSRSPQKITAKKSSSTPSKFDDDSDRSPNVFSRRKKNEKEEKQKISTPAKSATNEKTGRHEKVSGGKAKKKQKLNPSDDQLRDAICDILKEVDFNTATFTDILKQLAKQFAMDLNPRKASIKIMIQEELTKLADEADEEDGEEEAEA